MNHFDPDLSASSTQQSNLFPGLESPTARGGRSKAARRPQVGLEKNFVLDTNVLLHDPQSINRFAENHVWIPVDVLSELDRFKNEQSDRGANAREVHRCLSRAFASSAGLEEGVPTSGGGSLRLAVFDLSGQATNKASATLQRFRRIFPDTERVDHRIIATVLMLQEKAPGPSVLVTKDLNMQLKALAVGVRCEDYLNDKVEAKEVEGGALRQIDVHPHELQRFAATGELVLDVPRVLGLVQNEYVLLSAGDRKTIPARYFREGQFRQLLLPESLHIPRGASIKPANLGQQCFVDALLDPDIALVTCFGQAGTGKTLLAVAAGLHAVFGRQYTGLTVSRPVVAMGDTLGFLPGTLDEKMRPWLQPIYDAFDLLMPLPGLGGQEPNTQSKRKQNKQQPGHEPHHHAPHAGVVRKPWEQLIEHGVVEIEALCYIRGRSIPRRFFILDEAQQLTPLEAKTLVTRMSKGSKLVLVGDPGQIDNPYVDSRSNGLVYTRTKLKGSAITAHISLSKGERSPLAELGAKLM